MARTSLDDYACNLKGVATLALDRYNEAQTLYSVTSEADNMILTGRCQAFSSILYLITGVPAGLGARKLWQSAIDAM